MKPILRLAAIAALSGSFVAVNASSVWAQSAGVANPGVSSSGGDNPGFGVRSLGVDAAGGLSRVTSNVGVAVGPTTKNNNATANNQGLLTNNERAIIDQAGNDPASLAQAVQQILQARKDSGDGLSAQVAAAATSLAIGRNKAAAATITTTAIAVAKGNSVTINPEEGVIVVSVVAAASKTAPDQAGSITGAAATAAPDFLAQITQAAVTAAPSRAADVTAAAIKTNPSQAAAVAKAAATAAPNQAAAITTAAVAAAPEQATAITSDVSSVQGVNTQEVQTAGDTTTTESVETTNDGFDDIEAVKPNASQENRASETTPKS